jgi:hypothetical protein
VITSGHITTQVLYLFQSWNCFNFWTSCLAHQLLMFWSLGVADQWNPLAGQGQFLAFVNSPCQDPLGGASNICQFVSPEDVEPAFLQREADINNYGASIL